MPRFEWTCAGTKRISVSGADSSPPADGLVSVYRRSARDGNDGRLSSGSDGNGRRSPKADRLSSGSTFSSDGGDDCVHVLLSDGAHTFYECIALKDIRHMSTDEGRELEEVTAILLRPDDDTYKTSYKRVEGQLVGGSNDTKSTTSVKMSVRKTLANGIVRPVWQGQVNDICHAAYDDLPSFAKRARPDEDRANAFSGLSLSVALGDTINKLHKEIEALRTENRQLESNTLRWKSTSDKLSNRWEAEKSELTDRFLVLFNEHKARHVKTQRELDQLKGKGKHTEGAVRERSSLGSGKKNKEEFPDFEDEHDYATYDKETVERLAAGRSSSGKRRRLPESSQGSVSGFTNPHTGATEFANPKELFSSDEEEDGMKT